ncbi:MAG: EamA family transporter [Elainellaceae cyanobacterium]
MTLPDHSGKQQSESPISDEMSDDLTQVRENLQTFQQDLVAQLTSDINRLQAEKADLLQANHHLRGEQQELQKQQYAVSQQQQQQWAKQLAQALANRLYVLLVQKLEANRINSSIPSSGQGSPARDAAEAISTVDLPQQVRQQLVQDLSHYEGSMVERLNRMQQLEQQGEALLETLVGRIEAQGRQATGAALNLDDAASQDGRSVDLPQPADSQSRDLSSSPSPSTQLVQRMAAQGLTAPAPAVQPKATPASPLHRLKIPGQSLPQTGLIFILLSTLALSLHNVVVGIIGVPSSIFDVWELGGFIELKSLDSSLLILWLRMIFVMPLMAAIAGVIYPATWREIRAFASSRDRTLLRNVCGSGGFLFVSQVLIYIAIGQIGPGIAVTILFMYPIITVPLAWLLFGDRPTPLRIGVMLAISLGIVLAALPNLTAAESISILGVGTAVLAGIAFAFYLISMQLSFRRLHPVPVSVIQFFTIFLLTSFILLFHPVEIVPFSPLGMIVGGFVLGTLTLIGYLFNNFGVRLMGAARASIIASSGPVLTALLAFIITPGPNTVLNGVQILGILIVTFGITALALERLLSQQAKRKSSPPSETT